MRWGWPARSCTCSTCWAWTSSGRSGFQTTTGTTLGIGTGTICEDGGDGGSDPEPVRTLHRVPSAVRGAGGEAFCSHEPRVEPGEAVGSLIGSVVLVGDGLPDLEEELAAHLDGPRDLHPDAPEFGVQIPIQEASRSATARVVQRILRTKNMRPSREAVDVLHGFSSDVYAVAAGLNRALEPEEHRRPIHLDEARRALAILDEDRILPEAAPSARSGVAALLESDRPLSQAELARRAGISTQSWRNHRETLADVGVIREVEEGWRVCLPFSSERHRDVEDVLPWFLTEEPEKGMKRSQRQPTDVLMELVFDLNAEAEGRWSASPTPGSGRRTRRTWTGRSRRSGWARSGS